MSERRRSNLDVLFDEAISFDRACAGIADLQSYGRPAPQSVVDAVMFALRPGTGALGRANIQGYLAMIDEDQLRQMCTQLQHRNPRIARSWTHDETKFLIRVWNTCHAR